MLAKQKIEIIFNYFEINKRIKLTKNKNICDSQSKIKNQNDTQRKSEKLNR